MIIMRLDVVWNVDKVAWGNLIAHINVEDI